MSFLVSRTRGPVGVPTRILLETLYGEGEYVTCTGKRESERKTEINLQCRLSPMVLFTTFHKIETR